MTLKAKSPRGFVDRSSTDIRAIDTMVAAIRAVYERHGFEPVETPMVEYTEALGKFLPDSDRPNEGVFSFQDEDEQWLSLRYDLTAPLARFVAENYDALPKPYRSYRCGWVFRNEKPGPGRFRQFMQFDADTVGTPSIAADAEMCMMMADTLEALGIPRGQYVIRVNNRKVLDGVMEAIGLGGDEKAAQRLTVMRAIDKLDKFGIEGVRLLLGAGRKDESGDFTKGAGLDAGAIETVLSILNAKDATNAQTCTKMAMEFSSTPLGAEGCDELNAMSALFEAAGFMQDRILIDPSVVRGLEYYTGPVYEAELLFEVKNEDGVPVRFGSVGGGGRYDGLVSRFREEAVPATGFSIGVSRLATALKSIGQLNAPRCSGPVLVCVMDKERMGDYMMLAKILRDAGLKSEVYLGSAGMKAQMKYADKRNSACVVIQGSNEKEKGTVLIKDMILGASLPNIKERSDYLIAQQQAQMECPLAQMTDQVKLILARYQD